MAYYGRRDRRGEEMISRAIDVLASARRRGVWSSAHATLLVGLILAVAGLVLFLGSIILSLMFHVRPSSSIPGFAAVGIVGFLVMKAGYAGIRKRR
jgi:hypothetical protein